MTIWILALVLLASLAAAGYRQGAIRVGISLAGLLTGALLAMPLAPLIRRLLPHLGVANPILIWALGPFIVFVIVQIAFKSVGLFVHRKVEVFYKYKAGDLRFSLWERINRRLGACLGLVNGTVYLVLIALVFYPFSYLTYQLASGDQDSRLVRILDRVGSDIGSTGLVKAVAAVDPVPADYYQVADLLGLLYRDSRVHTRLGYYPLFMHLQEEDPFKQIGTQAYRELFTPQHPMSQILDNGTTKAILNNPEVLTNLWNLVVPNLADLRTYLETGKSPQYAPETILGWWSLDPAATLRAFKARDQELTTAQLSFVKSAAIPILSRARLVVYPDKKVSLEGLSSIDPRTVFAAAAGQATPTQPAPGGGPGRRGGPPGAAPSPAPGAPPANGTPTPASGAVQGRWTRTDSQYRLTVGNTSAETIVAGNQLTITNVVAPLVFVRN